MTGWTWHDPWWLLALLALAALALLRRRRRTPVLVVPFAAAWHRPGPSSVASWPELAAYGGLALLIGALARPQVVDEKHETRQQGYDIVLAIDLSGSMRAEDFERDGQVLNRLQAIKTVIEAFINRRPGDRIGIVVFGTRAYTLAPLTFDHDWLRRQTSRLSVGLIEEKTAIGDALGVALNRLDQGRRELGRQRHGAFVVLLTDGENTAGTLDPRDVLKLAVKRGITVYTVGAGREGFVPVPVFDESGRRITTTREYSRVDETLLREIAEATGGRYFRAEDADTVERAFAEIDRAQKIEFDARALVVTRELFAWLALPGAILLAAAAIGAAVHAHRESYA